MTAATLAWTAASWVQERKAASWPGRRLIRTGLVIVAAGIGLEIATLFPTVPVWAGSPAGRSAASASASPTRRSR